MVFICCCILSFPVRYFLFLLILYKEKGINFGTRDPCVASCLVGVCVPLEMCLIFVLFGVFCQ